MPQPAAGTSSWLLTILIAVLRLLLCAASEAAVYYHANNKTVQIVQAGSGRGLIARSSNASIYFNWGGFGALPGSTISQQH
jgi:hypothetical protein